MFGPKLKQLEVPPSVRGDADATEMVRAWVASDKSVAVTISGRLFNDPAIWGIFLVDLARHAARAYNLGYELDQAEVLARIKEGLDAEWSAPTAQAKGSLGEMHFDTRGVNKGDTL